MTIEQYCSCEPPGIGNGPDPDCPKHRTSNKELYCVCDGGGVAWHENGLPYCTACGRDFHPDNLEAESPQGESSTVQVAEPTSKPGPQQPRKPDESPALIPSKNEVSLRAAFGEWFSKTFIPGAPQGNVWLAWQAGHANAAAEIERLTAEVALVRDQRDTNLAKEVEEIERLTLELREALGARDDALRRLKRHEPTSHYNGRDIDSWADEARQLRAVLQIASPYLMAHGEEEAVRRYNAALAGAAVLHDDFKDLGSSPDETDAGFSVVHERCAKHQAALGPQTFTVLARTIVKVCPECATENGEGSR